jgi:hypothetical protein
MAKLETAVDPIFQKLTSGVDIRHLTTEEVEVLARWTGKTAVVLGYVTPQPAIVPEYIRKSLHPNSAIPPQMRFFYAYIQADMTLEGGYLQLRYGAEIPIIGCDGAPGYRFTICVFNHCLTVDFPPMLTGILYDLTESCSAQLWPQFIAAGTAELALEGPILISEMLLAICSRIKVGFNIGSLHT